MNVSSATALDQLAAWAHHRDESASHELVVRYAGLVQMAAQRDCGDVSLAADASQLAFSQLAQKAKSLLRNPAAKKSTWIHAPWFLIALQASPAKLGDKPAPCFP